jgi:hypothetical protein
VSRFGSDLVMNGSPDPGAVAATCFADISVPVTGPTMIARIVVRSDDCVISVIGGHDSAQPPATRPRADVALPYPEGCPADELSPRRCAYIVNKAITEAGMTGRVANVELLGDPECDGKPAGCMVMRTMTFVVRVRVTPADGVPSDHPVFCGIGGGASLLCTDMPMIVLTSPVGSGYHDISCNGEGGVGTCATPLPTIDPVAAGEAVPLEVASVVVPIDHAGAYVVDVGDAVLPNGILSDATATLANDTRIDVLIPDGVHLEIVGEDGTQLENAYQQGWRPGTERVHVRFTFTVESFDPGTTLILTQVAVR